MSLASPIAAIEGDPDRRLSRIRMLMTTNGFWLVVVLAALFAFFVIACPPGTFLTLFNVRTLLLDGSGVLILAAAALVVIIAGGIDLSAGSLMTLGGVVAFITMRSVGLDRGWTAITVGIVVAIGVAAAWGLVNGVLVAYASITPFVVTLGSLGAGLGAARLLSGAGFASVGPPEFNDTVGVSRIVGLPTPFVIAAVVVLVFGVLLGVTRFGEHVYLVGANKEGARRAGIGEKRIQLQVFLLAGGLAGAAGVVDFARFDSVDIATGHTRQMIAAIAAVIIGGASLNGGVGSMAPTVVAAFIPVVLNNGLIILGVESYWQDIAIGAILVGAVGFDQWRGAGSLQNSER